VSQADLVINYDAPPTLGRFLGSDAPVRLVIGPVGSGKSSACAMELLRRALEQRPGPDGKRRTRFAVIRNSYRELADTTVKTVQQWLPDDLGVWRMVDNAFDLSFNDIECEILFRALDRPADAKKLLSLELTGAYINEAKEIPRAVFDLLQTRIGRYPAVKDGGCTWSGVWMDSNPPDTDDYLYKIFEEQRPEGFELYRQPGGRSPEAENVSNLPADYYARIARGKNPDWVKVYVDGEYGFVQDGRPIYPEYKDALHFDATVQPIPRSDITLGMDFGLTPAAVLCQRDADGQLQVFDELVSEDMGAVAFARELASKLKGEYYGRGVTGWGDPAGEQRAQTDERTPFDVVLAAGLPVSPAPTNDYTLRREAVAGMLLRLTMTGRPALVIGPKCANLRKAMAGGYCYKRLQISGDERFHDKPDKGRYSHVAEALQYAAVGLGEDRRAVDGSRSSMSFTVRRSLRT
jgi:hypothetical protein